MRNSVTTLWWPATCIIISAFIKCSLKFIKVSVQFNRNYFSACALRMYLHVPSSFYELGFLTTEMWNRIPVYMYFLGKTAWQSSYFNIGFYPPTHITDGSLQSLSSTNNEYQPWARIDLGAVMLIGRITFYNRASCCWGERIYNNTSNRQQMVRMKV